MIITHNRTELTQQINEWKSEGLRIGFVPTMGALHQGHLSLVKIARRHADRIVVSIFVNPTQFAPHEDFGSYPRTEEQDAEMLRAAGADLLYFPDTDTIYPDGMEAQIIPGEAAQGLETDFRPHFFGGVVNVVARLFDHARPDSAVFGEKDYQQLCVIREMTISQKLPIEIIGGPVVRDGYGLALSSRNAYLSPAEMDIARTLNGILFDAAAAIARTPENATDIIEKAKDDILGQGFRQVDYLAWRDALSLQDAKPPAPSRLLFAGWLGKTRLLDNVAVA